MISTRVTIAVHEERLNRLEQLNDNVESLRDELAKTREDLIRTKMEKPVGPRQ